MSLARVPEEPSMFEPALNPASACCETEASPDRVRPIAFIEGTRFVRESQLQAHDITQHHVTKFYREHIARSAYYDQLKHIVEPSLKEFESPGSLDTSGEHSNTVVPGLQHKYPQTGLLLV